MTLNLLRILATCTVLLLPASPVLAHHFFARESDTPVSIAGTVTKFEMRNPHSRLYLEVRDRSGNLTPWTIELGSVANLIARGWQKTSLKPGDMVTVEVILGRGTPTIAAARELTLPDGRVVFAGSHAGDRDRR
jgi:hypothetical protein